MPAVQKKQATKSTQSSTPVPVVSTPVATPVAAPAVAPAPVSTSPQETPSKVVRTFDELVEECVQQAQSQVTGTRSLVTLIREARKAHDREFREVQRSSRRTRRPSADGAKKPLTGFAKPCRISDDLADFLQKVAGNSDVSRGMLMSRTDVTKRLNDYFKNNNLRDKDDKRTILYKNDPKLVALLGGGVPAGEKLTYFNLQSVLKDKFIKEESGQPGVQSAPQSVKA